MDEDTGVDVMAISDQDFEALCLAAGLLKSAVADARMNFSELGDDGISVSEFLKGIQDAGSKPHWWPNTFQRDSLDQKLIEAACGEQPTLAARAALLKAAGPELYAEVLADWGCSPNTLAPGKNPKSPVAKSEEKQKTPRDHSKNPFHKSNWNVTNQSKLVASLGLEKAAGIARSVGVKIGDTRPNPDF
jgi:hypothetical protein